MKKKIAVWAAMILALALVVGAVIYFTVIRPQRIKQQEHLQAVAHYRADKTEIFLRENDRYEDYEVDVAFLGDSLTDGYDVTAAYPQFLVCNRGIGGDTTFDLQARLQTSVYDLKPQVAVMLIGANNADTMLDNYEDILIGLRDNLPDTKVVLLSMTAMGGEHWGPKNPLACYNNVSIKALAEKYGFAYVDLFTPLFDVATGEVREGYTTDGGHFTHEGYEVVTAQITPVLEALLGK